MPKSLVFGDILPVWYPKVLMELDLVTPPKITKVDLKVNGESFVCGTNSCQSCTFTEAENKKTIYIQPAQTVSVYDKMIFNINGCASEEITLTNCPWAIIF